MIEYIFYNIELCCFTVLILVVNCYSVNLATCVQNVFTAAKLVAVLIIISGGMYKLAQGEISNDVLNDSPYERLI